MIEGARDFEDVQLQLKAAQEQARYESMSEKQIAPGNQRLEKQMPTMRAISSFEKAAEARDRLAELKRSVFGASPEEPLAPSVRCYAVAMAVSPESSTRIDVLVTISPAGQFISAR